jgi:sulfonate transport system permease protein
MGRLLVESQQRFDASAAWGLLFIIGTFGYLTIVFLMWAEQRVAIPAEPDRPGNRLPARTG